MAYAPHNPANAPSYSQPAPVARVVTSLPPQNGRPTAVAAVALPHFPQNTTPGAAPSIPPSAAIDLLTRFQRGETSMQEVMRRLNLAPQNKPAASKAETEKQLCERFKLRERVSVKELLRMWEMGEIDREQLIEGLIAAAEEDPNLELFLKTHIEYHTAQVKRRS